MTLSIKQIMLLNIDQVTGEDGNYQPSDALLDEIWDHAVKTTDNRGMLMSNVINGDEAIDDHLILLASTNSINEAVCLRKRAQELFRTYAYSLAEEYEYDVMEAIKAPPEPEPEPEFDDGIPF